MARTVISHPLTGDYVIEGTRVARVSTRRGVNQLRWNVMRAWKLDETDPDGFHYWLLMRSGESDVYHRDPTPCRTASGEMSGSPSVVDDLPDDAVPCPDCRPQPPDVLEEAAEAGETIEIRMEFPRRAFIRCRTPDDLVIAVATKTDRDRNTSVMLSEPARDLIAQCRRDAEFRGRLGQMPPAVGARR